MKLVTKMEDCIGTLRVTILEIRDVVFDFGNIGKGNIFCTAQLNRQTLKTKPLSMSQRDVRSRRPLLLNHSFILSVCNLDEILHLSVYHYDFYSQDDYIGGTDWAISLIEYYGTKETEAIILPLKEGTGKIVIQMAFKNLQ